MRTVIALSLICATLARIQPALADTLRCGGALIEPGADAAYVLEKCGQPNQALGSGSERGSYANTAPSASLRAGRWRYHRGPGKFPVVVAIGDDGRVQAIRFERHRD